MTGPKKYALPTAINVGLTDSNVPDGQAGVEKAATMLLGMLAGADAYGGMGISGADQGFKKLSKNSTFLTS
ncbi:hypothetical protein HKBW3S42_00953 [Candidatus Hakubella thermalkaliphila]|uniref:Uncharacterized protein n=1 Tax=Candidatus Hakubella thermalkaliphila TaxID=2754717 RepID=A0A6V8PK74_9ACTN|nr:hypothetical protein HKBW3S42_00953 [Candidatus Hakubella thermalkaliphila]